MGESNRVFSIINGVDNVNWLYLKEFKSWSDEGLTLETSAFKLFTVANLCYQLSW